ncbi:MAG: hypothetical protein ABIT83_17340, partial [Massilia sp.]
HTAGQFGWPADFISLAPDLPVNARGAAPSAVLARLAHHLTLGDAPLTAMLVACASHIDDASVADWAAAGTLFGAARPQGLIPGEGAAGLLLTDVRQARALDDNAWTLLHTVAEARRDASADAAKRADPAVLAALVDKLLARAALPAAQLAMLVADTGHRNSRVMELMALASAAAPQLDAVADVLRVGAGAGTCGTVPYMTALALAHQQAQERAAPVLCISNEDPYRRSAALIVPAPSLT